MRLLYVLPEYPPHYGGGIATFYDALLPALVRMGHEVDVLVGSAFSNAEPGYEREGVQVQFLAPERVDAMLGSFARFAVFPELQRYLAAAWAMYEQAEGGAHYDAVEVTDWGLLFVPWVIARDRPPSVVRLAGSTGQIYHYDPVEGAELQGELALLLEAALLAEADALHSTSTANQVWWQEATHREVTYFPPPLRPESPVRVGEAERVEAGFVAARIQHWKGPALLCEALKRLGEAAPEVVWAGRDTPYGGVGTSMDAHLRSTYPTIWGSRIRPIGKIQPSEVALWQVKASFVVVPSLWDVFNFTVIEAMRAGAILVCSTGAGAVDLVEDGVNGFVYPAENAEACADRIAQARSLSPKAVGAMGDAARATILERCNPAHIAEMKVQLYRAAAKNVRAPQTIPVAQLTLPSREAHAPLAFLDHQSLGSLVRYTGRRLRDKMLPGS